MIDKKLNLIIYQKTITKNKRNHNKKPMLEMIKNKAKEAIQTNTKNK
jgi:hypothetical protein